MLANMSTKDVRESHTLKSSVLRLEASNGREVLEVLTKLKDSNLPFPDLILMDL